MRPPNVTRTAGLLMPLLAAATVASAQTAPAPPRLDQRPAAAATPAPTTPAGAPAPDATAPARGAAADLRACTPDAPPAAARRDARSPAAAPLPRIVERLPGGTDDEAAARREPAIECLVVVDEDGTRIEELRVRGRTERLVVHPRDGGRPYEIQLMDAGRDPSAKSGPGRGGAGQRVWPVLAF